MQKVCIQCERPKSDKEFKVSRGKESKVCTPCNQENAREVQTRHLAEQHGLEPDGDIKLCGACLTVKSVGDFGKSSRSKDGHVGKCKPCKKAKRKVQHVPVQPVKEESGVSSVLNEATDVVEAATDLVDEVTEVVTEAKSTWSRLSAWFKRLF